ncbi:MAG: hypothetical protein HY074_12030 [Deltaproteobacteria bacterium]|nr:hypothetical protein [Deltaproteobacteria bacterium]
MAQSAGRPLATRLLIALAILLLWQRLIAFESQFIPKTHTLGSSEGIYRLSAVPFLYFYWNFGVFPVAAPGVPDIVPAGLPATEVLAAAGPRLRNDLNTPAAWGRMGDYARLFLYLPSLWLGAEPAEASSIPAHSVLFVLALLSVVVAFWRQHRLVQGVVFAVLVGSSSFQLFETYEHDNLFSLPITIALFTLAFNLRYFAVATKPGFKRFDIGVAAFTALMLATAREIRSEPVAIGAFLVLVYLGNWNFKLKQRLLMLAVLVTVFLGTALAWAAYFDSKYRDAMRFVQDHGGKPAAPLFVHHHPIWHAIYCGLGDFGGERGYKWSDHVAYEAALPELRKRFYPDLQFAKIPFYFERASQPNEAYLIKPEGIPEYSQILRERLLEDFRRNPGWYARLAAKRVRRMLFESPPLQLNLVLTTVEAPLRLWILIPLLLWAAATRRFFELKLMIFLLPLGATALLIFSDLGTINYQIAHLAGAALFLGSHWVNKEKPSLGNAALVSSATGRSEG